MAMERLCSYSRRNGYCAMNGDCACSYKSFDGDGGNRDGDGKTVLARVVVGILCDGDRGTRDGNGETVLARIVVINDMRLR
jgi:hypothetical protein